MPQIQIDIPNSNSVSSTQSNTPNQHVMLVRETIGLQELQIATSIELTDQLIIQQQDGITRSITVQQLAIFIQSLI